MQFGLYEHDLQAELLRGQKNKSWTPAAFKLMSMTKNRFCPVNTNWWLCHLQLTFIAIDWGGSISQSISLLRLKYLNNYCMARHELCSNKQKNKQVHQWHKTFHLFCKISQHPLDELAGNFVQTFSVSRGWSLRCWWSPNLLFSTCTTIRLPFYLAFQSECLDNHWMDVI